MVGSKKLSLKLSEGMLSIKSGAGYLPINQYLSLHPLETILEIETIPEHRAISPQPKNSLNNRTANLNSAPKGSPSPKPSKSKSPITADKLTRYH
jgi:hypothetical protein